MANKEHAQQMIGSSVGGHDAKSFLERMSVSHNFQPEELDVIERMWACEDVVIRYGGPPAGLIMKHVDLVRLLDMGGGISGWLNDVIMDCVGCMVNSINIECHVFSTYLRECFLMGKDKGYRALRKVCQKSWKRKVGEEGDVSVVVPDMWLFPLIRVGDPHWWLMYVDVSERSYAVIDPFSPNSAAPTRRVQAAQDLLQWVLEALYGDEITFKDFEYCAEFAYKLPEQKDGFNCGIYVALYMLVIARGLTEYEIAGPINNFRWKLALALEAKNPELFLPTPP